MGKELFLIVVVVLLIVVAGVQAFELNSIKNSLSENGLKLSSSGSSVKVSSSTSVNANNLPKSLDNLPGMVGGC